MLPRRRPPTARLHATLGLWIAFAAALLLPARLPAADTAQSIRITLPEALLLPNDRRESLTLELRTTPGGAPPELWAWHPLAPHRYHPLAIQRIEWDGDEPVRIEAAGTIGASPPWIGGADVKITYALETQGEGSLRTYRVEWAPHPAEKGVPAVVAGTSASIPHVARHGIAYNAWTQVPRLALLTRRSVTPPPAPVALPAFRSETLPAPTGDAWLDACRNSAATALVALTGGRPPDGALDAALAALRKFPEGADARTPPPAAYDLRTAVTAAALGLVTLALPETAETRQESSRAALTVRRFLETAIGDRGCGTGQRGLAESWEVVAPFLLAWADRRSEDLTSGTGTGWAGLWVLSATPAADAGLLPAFLPHATPSVRARLRRVWGAAKNPAPSPLQRWCAAVADKLPVSAEGIPPIVEDRRMQAYLVEIDGQRMAFHAGASPAPEVSPAGQFHLQSGGHDWVLEPTTLPLFAWPAVADWNVIQALESETTARAAATWSGKGQRSRVEVRPPGSASFGTHGGSFQEADEASENGAELEGSHHWRTLGLDWSGRSGAESLLVFVEGNDGLRDRQQAWQLHVGDWPKESVRINGRTFEVRLPGERRVFAGTVLYPLSAHIAHESDGRGGGRLRIYRWAPGTRAPEDLGRAMDRLEEQLNAFMGKGADTAERDLREFRLEDDTEEKTREAAAARLQQLYFLKLLRETSSVKMGAPDRKPRARDSWVIALTVSEGAPPEIRPAQDENGPLLWAGPQPVHYEEDLVRFGATP